MIKLSDILKEIGEAEKKNAYPWKLKVATDDEVYYQFKTDKYQYAVGFSKIKDKKNPSYKLYDLLFTPIESKGEDTNEGVMLRIMTTVTDIARDFVNKYKPDEVTIHPITRSAEDDPKRSRIYGIFLKKNTPEGYNLMQTGESYRIIKK